MKTKVGISVSLILSLFIIYFLVCRNKPPVINSSFRSYRAALELIGAGKYEQAIQDLKALVEQDSGFCPAYSKLVKLSGAQHQLPVVQKYFEELHSKNPENPHVYYALGLLHKENEDTQKAIDEFKRSIGMGNRCAYVFTEFVKAYGKKKEFTDAIGYLDSLAQTAQRRGQIYYGLGLIFSRQKQWDKAVQALDLCLKMEPELVPAYLEESDVYFNKGKLQSALDIQSAGYEKSLRTGDVEMQHKLLGERGKILKLAGKPQEAMKCYESALAIVRRIGDRKSEEIYLGNIGAIHAGIAEYPQALEFYGKAIGIAENLGNKKDAVIWLSNSGVVLRSMGRLQEALANHQKALKIAREIQDRKLESLNIGNIGSIYFFLAKFKEALSHYEEAIAIDKEIRDNSHLGTWYLNTGLCYFSLNEYSRAQIYFEKALPILKQIGNKSEEGRAFNAFGTMFWSLGDYSRALDYTQKALSIAREIGDRASESRSLAMIGNVYSELGDYQKALQYTEQAVLIAREIGDKYQESAWLGNLGAHNHALGHQEKAMEYYSQSLRLSKEIGNLADEPIFIGNIGLLQSEMGKLDGAQKNFYRSLEIAKKIGNRHSEALELLNLGSLSFLQADYAHAIQLFMQALKISRRIHEVPLIWMAHSSLALVYKQQGKYNIAREHLLKAIEKIENVRSSLLLKENRATFSSINLDVYEQLIDIFSLLNKTDPAAGLDRVAFEYAEKAKARNILEILYSGKLFHRLKNIPVELRAGYLHVESQMEAKHAALAEELAGSKEHPDQNGILELENEIQSLERKKARLQQEIEKKYPEYYQLEHPNILSVSQIQEKLLDEHRLMIEYFVASEKIYCWIFTRRRMDFKTIEISRRELKNRLARISPLFANEKRTENSTIDHRWANIRIDLLHELYRDLIGNVAGESLQKKTDIIIVPDDELFFFPFELLVSQYNGKTVRYLIEDHPISYIPAASLLDPALQNEETAANGLLAFGNPDFGSPDDGGILPRISSLLRGKSKLRNQKFARLPYAEDEVKAIASQFKRSMIFTGKNATESNFKKMAADFKLIHLATHNITDDQQPMYSKIVFARGDEHNGEDGYLQTYEIFDLKLHANLVTLSGCDTGLGKLRRGEGIIGMTRAFFYAGAASLLVSLWPVNDESTARLMTLFYANLRMGMSKSRALQQAKIAMIHSGDWQQNPFYWGPFILIGDWKNGL